MLRSTIFSNTANTGLNLNQYNSVLIDLSYNFLFSPCQVNYRIGNRAAAAFQAAEHALDGVAAL
jgi:hypothetical protein